MFGKDFITTIEISEKTWIKNILSIYQNCGFEHLYRSYLKYKGPHEFEKVLLTTRLASYALKALDILGIEYGPAHFELMDTPDGVAIVEMEARIQGSVNPWAHRESMGNSQLDMTILSYLEPDKFKKLAKFDYQKKRSVFWAELISSQKGVIEEILLVPWLESLPSTYSMRMHLNIGDQISPTIDLFTSPGDIYLIHDDHQQLRKDYQFIRTNEKHGYVLSPQLERNFHE